MISIALLYTVVHTYIRLWSTYTKCYFDRRAPNARSHSRLYLRYLSARAQNKNQDELRRPFFRLCTRFEECDLSPTARSPPWRSKARSVAPTSSSHPRTAHRVRSRGPQERGMCGMGLTNYVKMQPQRARNLGMMDTPGRSPGAFEIPPNLN